MPKPRHSQISLADTPFYHCISRCVRRAFLCGFDSASGTDYEHRRGWIEDKLLELGQIFALDVCAYAIMSNHYHVVLHIDADQAQGWDDREVVARWHALFRGTDVSRRYAAGAVLSASEQGVLAERVALWRARLMDISWFMRVLNESIARMANAEDQCRGRFWEGRFRCQALLDEAALAACLAYVDLNPVRAGMAETPEGSDFTSIRKRAVQAWRVGISSCEALEKQVAGLMPFAGYPREDMPAGLPFRLVDYLELVDWTGRQLRADKRGHIDGALPPILERLDLTADKWLKMTRHFESRFRLFVGAPDLIRRVCERLGYARTPGIGACRALMPG